MRVLRGADGVVLGLAFCPDGGAVAAAVHHQGVFLWNLGVGEPTPVRLDPGGDPSPAGLTFSADGRSLAWLAGGRRRAYDRDARAFSEQSFAVTPGRTRCVAHSADGGRVVSEHGLPDYRLTGWRAGGGEWVPAWGVSTADLAVEKPTLSPDGRLLAMLARSALGDRWASNPRRVEVRDAGTAAVRAVGEYPYNLAGPLLFSPDGRQLVGSNAMTLLVWDVPDGPGPLPAPRRVRNDTRKQFTGMAYHPSGRFLYATSNDATAHVFDAATWARAGRFTWRLGRLRSVAVSPDGTLAAAGGDGGAVVVWDVDL